MWIVVYDDEKDGTSVIRYPQTEDKNCKGVLKIARHDDAITVFNTEDEALDAIRRTSDFAELCKSQGKLANEDSLSPCLKNIKLQQVMPYSIIPYSCRMEA